MAFNTPQPPLHVQRAYEKGLTNFIDRGDPLRAVFSQAQPGQHEARQIRHEAHQVFSLGLRHIWKAGKRQVDGEEVKNVRSAGWRFVAGDETLAGSCHVSESPGGQEAKLAGLSRLRELTQVFGLIDKFYKLPEIEKAKKAKDAYHVVVLRIPGLVEAFWLRSDPPKMDDWVVPFLTRIKDEKGNEISMRAFTMRAFLQDHIFNIAEKRLKYSEEEG